jgi:hypothetical protein
MEVSLSLAGVSDFATLSKTYRWPDAFLHIADRPAPK